MKKYTITRTHTAVWDKVITEEELNGKTLDQYISLLEQHGDEYYSFTDSADLVTDEEFSVEEEEQCR